MTMAAHPRQPLWRTTAATLALAGTLAVFLVPAARAVDINFGFGAKTPATTAPVSFADLAEKLLPTVVNISSSQKGMAATDMPEMPEFPPGSPFEEFFQDFMDKRGGEGGVDSPQASLGSGVIIDAAKGLIVTNSHVIKDADQIRVTLHDDQTLTAKVLGIDEKTDLAVLQVDKGKTQLASAPFGNSDPMRVGDWVVAIGNPFGLGGTVTTGIISARARDINSGPYDDYIQTDASINRGNSGGPMFNLRGEIIGINTAIFSPSGGSVGIGFAIPSNIVRPVVEQIVQYGRTKRGWIGVRIQSVTDDIAESLGLGSVRGALIASVTPMGPADRAGLKPGDIVTTYQGQALNQMRQLPRLVAETAIGTNASLGVWRDGKTMTITIKVEELEQAEANGLAGTGMPDDATKPEETGIELEQTGLTIGVITPSDRKEMDLPETTKGVIVLAVKPGSEAAAKGLELGDIIIEVNQQKLTDPAKVAAVLRAARKDKKSSVLLLVDAQGKGDVRFVALKLAP
jgi:serine protease Do